MKLIILGAPGAGKGTQAQILAQHLQIPQIATGDMLRAAIASGSAIGSQIKAIISAGDLVPDTLILQLVQQRINADECRNGFILDGFPRTLAQAEQLAQLAVNIDVVLELQVPDAVIIGRISGRRVHIASGRVYHTEHNPPQVADTDDVTGEPLEIRGDDNPDKIRHRLQLYHQLVMPVIEWYQNLSNQGDLRYAAINGNQAADAITQQLLQAIEL